MYSISFQEDSLLPRERLVTEGVESLSNQELLAILLRTGTRQSTVFEIAQKVLNQLSCLTDLKKMTLQVFSVVKDWLKRCKLNWEIKNKSTWWRSILILKIKSFINKPFLSAQLLEVLLNHGKFSTML